MYDLRGGMAHEHCTRMQVLEVLRKASQAVKVTWKTDELDKENKDPMPASGAQTVPHTGCFVEVFCLPGFSISSHSMLLSAIWHHPCSSATLSAVMPAPEACLAPCSDEAVGRWGHCPGGGHRGRARGRPGSLCPHRAALRHRWAGRVLHDR